MCIASGVREGNIRFNFNIKLNFNEGVMSSHSKKKIITKKALSNLLKAFFVFKSYLAFHNLLSGYSTFRLDRNEVNTCAEFGKIYRLAIVL